jgi:hypothetical protein
VLHEPSVWAKHAKEATLGAGIIGDFASMGEKGST